jgi:RNA-splicing ligase RtcB
MPDVHWGIGATVGSVIPTRGAIIAAAVGVDIGCGMMAVETSLNARDLPDNLHGIREAIEKAVPVGRTDNRGKNDRGARKDEPAHHLDVWAGAPFQITSDRRVQPASAGGTLRQAQGRLPVIPSANSGASLRRPFDRAQGKLLRASAPT